MFLNELLNRIRFWREADRLGPDIPWSHWRLHFKRTMRRLCRRKFASFGLDAEFRPGAFAIGCSKINLGERVVIRPGTMLFTDPRSVGGGIKVADDVMIGAGVHLYTQSHCFDNPEVPIIAQGHHDPAEVTLCRGCWVGANVIILPGVVIGENAVVGAGSVVTKSIPPRVVAVGTPARVIRSIS